MLEIIKDLAFDGKRIWKAVQAGTQLSTSAALQLSWQAMSAHNLQYFLTYSYSMNEFQQTGIWPFNLLVFCNVILLHQRQVIVRGLKLVKFMLPPQLLINSKLSLDCMSTRLCSN